MPTPARKLTHLGLTLTLKEWADRTGLGVETIRSRVDHQGWPVAKALATPAASKFAARGRKPLDEPKPCPPVKRHASGRAWCRWQDRGQSHCRYFGAWGTDAAKAAYRRFQLEWAAGLVVLSAAQGDRITVAELAVGYLKYVNGYYVKAGKRTPECLHQRTAVSVLTDHYGPEAADDFTPAKLRACRQAMVERGWVRKTVNAHVWRVARCFKWGVSHSLVHPDVHARLAAVEKLQAGRTAAPDRPKVKPVPAADVDAVLPLLHADGGRRAVLDAMVRFHLLTGMRPAELCFMRVPDVDATGDVWRYEVPPELNKNEHREKRQRYWIGPRAQAILSPRLADPAEGGRLWWFPPRGRNGTKRTPVSRGAYGEAVRMACDAAGVARWHPHQLRHNRATEVERRYEDDAAAAAAIGDTPRVATEVYVDPSDAVRRRIAKEMG